MSVAAEQPRELTVAAICALTGESERTVQRRVLAWFEKQTDASVPRVRRAKRPWDDRWAYLVDAESYHARSRRLRGKPPAIGSDAARDEGCECCAHPDDPGAVIVRLDCALHGRPLGD